MDELQTQTREIRGRILKILNINYPEPLSDRVITSTLQEIAYPANLSVVRGYISYLTDKGYVAHEIVEHAALTMPMWMVRLTAKGKDLLEHNIPHDPGIQL